MLGYWNAPKYGCVRLTLYYVIMHEITSLIYTKYTCLHYGTYLLFCMSYTKSVSFIEFSMDCCIMMTFNYVTILVTKLLHFKLSKLGQILHVDT